MGNSAAIAKERLMKGTFQHWLARVDEFLQLDGLSITDFPDSPFDSYHKAGFTPGRVADVFIGCVREAKRKGTKSSVVNG